MRAMAWRGGAESQARERATKKEASSCPAVEKTMAPLAFFSSARSEGEEERARAPRPFASPSSHLARRRGDDLGEALEVAEGATRQGKREQKSAAFGDSFANTPPCV